MKKVFIFLLLIVLSAVIFVSCNQDQGVTINVVMPDGAPALVMAKAIYDKFSYEGYDINFEIVAGAPNIQAAMFSGDADIAVLPSNMAANLYNGGIDIKLLSTNVFGLLYLVSNQPFEDINSLKGKVVYNLGQGNTPDFVFKYVLELNDIEYVEQDTPVQGKVALRYAANAQNLISIMVAGQADYAVLGEPQVSQALAVTQDSDNPFEIVLNLQEEWTDGYPQVATVAKNSVIQNHADMLDALLEVVKDNVEWVVKNADKAVAALQEHGSNISGFSSQTIIRCNIGFVPSQEAKEGIEEYFEVMHEFNPNFIGKKMPDNGFYR
jgi:NitT/TauT family transport system substrate-binding protein